MAPTSGNYSILSDTDTLDADSVFIAPDNVSGAPNMLGSTSVPLSLQHIKGYQVSAIVVCVIVVLAVILCHVTWRLRFKIVLRQKDPNQQSTVVQNLVALELHVMKSGMDNGGEGLPGQLTILQEEGDVPGGLDSNVLVPVNQVSDDDAGITREGELPPGTAEEDIELSDIREEDEDKSQRGEETGRLSSTESKRHDQVMARMHGSVSRGKTGKRKGKYTKRGHHVSLRSIRLSSGLTLPRRVDINRLSSSGKHPLILEEDKERGESVNKHGFIE